MAWATPTQRTTGDNITAAIWNTDVVNNLIAIHGVQVVTGSVSAAAAVLAGTGFTCGLATTTYTLTFSPAFSAVPCVLVSPTSGQGVASTTTPTTSSCTIIIRGLGAGTGAITAAFNFVAFTVT